MDTLEKLEKESWDQMQSQFADVTSAVFDEQGELSEQIILKELGATKKSAQEFFRQVLNKRKQDSLNLQEIVENYLRNQRFLFLASTVLTMIWTS